MEPNDDRPRRDVCMYVPHPGVVEGRRVNFKNFDRVHCLCGVCDPRVTDKYSIISRDYPTVAATALAAVCWGLRPREKAK